MGLVKAGLRRYLAAHPDGEWWEFVPEVARALRVLPSSATGLSPYLLVFKHQPRLPLVDSLSWGEELLLEDVAPAKTEVWLQEKLAQSLYRLVQDRLEARDRKMVKGYLKSARQAK